MEVAERCLSMAAGMSFGLKRSRFQSPSVEATNSEIDENPSPNQKTRRVGGGGEQGAWTHLDIILSIQSKDLSLERKIELAFEFVSSYSTALHQCHQPVPLPRLASFLGEWIQTILISPERGRKSSGLLESCLDPRCWAVLRFSLDALPSISVSNNLLRAIATVSSHSSSSDDAFDASAALLSRVFDCLSAILLSKSRFFGNVGVELWLSCATEVVGLVRKLLLAEGKDFSEGCVQLRFSKFILEQLCGFLRFHPNPKNVFRVFVERLLEPLLELSVLLDLKANTQKNGDLRGLVGIVEEVLSNGLFHTAHISGFLSSKSTNSRLEPKESKATNESYHKHLFRRMENIIAEKKATALGSFGFLFHIFATRVKAWKRSSSSLHKGDVSLGKGTEISLEAQSTNKPLFEVFVNFMEPLLLECKRFAVNELAKPSVSDISLIEANCMLKSVNEILAAFIQEKIYARLEDTEDGTYYNFLVEVFDSIFLIACKICSIWSYSMEAMNETMTKMLCFMAREVLVALGRSLEIEHKIVGNDLVRFWLILLAYSSLCTSNADANPSSPLKSEILDLGCHIIKVYGELRQVDIPIFSLCKAMKFLMLSGDSVALDYQMYAPFLLLSGRTRLSSIAPLLCSQEFRMTISEVVKTMPEGQASSCIQQLTVDVIDSLEWMACRRDEADIVESSLPDVDLKAEIFGRFLSEIYTVLLDSTNVTSSNCVLVCNSVKSLMETIRPKFNYLVQDQPDTIDNFLCSIVGMRLCEGKIPECYSSFRISSQSVAWILQFFFSMYLSCRSLYGQLISLLPPKLSRKASEAMGCVIPVSCGVEWMEFPDTMDEGFFSWILKPSISLANMIQSLHERFLSNSCENVHSLVYVINAMALQRLVDLNRQINAYCFLHERNAKLHQKHFESGSSWKKLSRKWKRLVKVSRMEAKQLTNYLTNCLVSFPLEVPSASKNNEVKFKETESECENSWNFCICSLSEKSLPIAIWSLLCQNTDVWCAYATKANIDKFCYLLLHSSLFCRSTEFVRRQITSEASFPRRVTMHDISLKFISDVVLREESVIAKYFASCFCHIMRDRISSVISLDTQLESSSKVSSILEQNLKVITDSAQSQLDASLPGPFTVRSDMFYLKCCEREPFTSCTVALGACEGLLDLLSSICEVPIDSKSSLVYSTCILNLEKLLVSSMSSYSGDNSALNFYELLRVFVSCRRTLKYLAMATMENFMDRKSPSSFVVFDDGQSTEWIVKSVFEIVRLLYTPLEHYSSQVKHNIFLLLDHTADILFIVSKGKAISTEVTVGNDMNLNNEFISNDDHSERDESVEADKHSVSLEILNSASDIEHMAEILAEQMEIVLADLRRNLHAFMVDGELDLINWDTLSSVVSCSRAFLWGLCAALDNINGNCSEECSRLSSVKWLFSSKISSFVNLFTDLVNLCLRIMLICDQKESETSNADETDGDPTNGSNCWEEKSSSFLLKSAINGFNHSRVIQHLNTSLLQSLLKGDTPQIAFALKELFMASSAILKFGYVLSSSRTLELPVVCSHLELKSTHILFATSLTALQEMAERNEIPDPFSFMWLGGIAKYLEVLGCCVNFYGIELPINFYNELIDAHLRAIGRCISLLGRSATLSSNLTNSSAMFPQSLKIANDTDKPSADRFKYIVNAFRARLKMSFEMLIKKPSRLYISAVMKALERALVGVHRWCNMVYELSTGNLDGGHVSPCAAAGLDCLDLVLLLVPGSKKVVQKSISGLLSAVFNIIIHLQNPSVFYLKRLPSHGSTLKPDGGAVILMSVYLITKIAGGRSYTLEISHTSQCLHIPTALFQNFHQQKVSNVPYLASSSENQELGMAPSTYHSMDYEFTAELYVACCRLLSTTVRNRKSEVGQCAALLGDSMRALLNCLEMVDHDSPSKKLHFCWEVKELVKCASFLRRIYEEIRQQKDVFGRYAADFLSSYVSVYSGYGPLKSGIQRDVDEAMRPGVYSLIDICAPKDLQRLHTVLSDGPCRSTLADLQRDYRLNFLYEGKI